MQTSKKPAPTDKPNQKYKNLHQPWSSARWNPSITIQYQNLPKAFSNNIIKAFPKPVSNTKSPQNCNSSLGYQTYQQTHQAKAFKGNSKPSELKELIIGLVNKQH